jgi:DNA primase
MLDQSTVDRIIDAARIQEVVSDYVTLRKRGVNMIGLCPFHNEKTPSFTVSPAKGIFKCFGCGKGGNAVHFIMEHEQISYYEALKFLAHKYHIEFKEREFTPEEMAARNDRESMFLVNEYAQKYFSNTLHNHIEGKSIGLSYFRERAFRDDIIRKFQLGYALDLRDDFTQTAIRDGYNKEYLVKTGLTLENEQGQLTDRFRGRVIFPVHTLSGKVVAFGGRIIRKDDKTAKYVNSPESEIYHKSNELYGIYFAKQAIVREDRCYLVEGYTDVISMHQTGIENVVASSGTSLTPGQIRLIHRFTDNVTIIYDGDPAGIKASIRGIDMLLEEGLNIRVLLLPDGDDPDSFARKTNAADFIEFVNKNSVDFMRFKTRLLIDDAGNDPVKRAALISDIVRSISIIPNQVIRGEYVKECSILLKTDEAMLYHEINKLKASAREKSVAQQTSAQTQTIPTESPAVLSKSLFDNEERNLLQLLIKYGHLQRFYLDEEKKQLISVAEYVISDLEMDDLTFHNPLHQRMLNEYKQHCMQKNESAEKFFTFHPDSQISQLAVELLSEKYTLSKVHSKMKEMISDEERLNDLTPRLIYEYKMSIVIEQMRLKLAEMKASVDAGNNTLVDSLMKDIRDLDEAKKELSKKLGERIIIKI